LPGVNGDEAWYGVQVQDWLRGEPLAWRTPTGNVANLLYLLPLAAVHVVCEPSIAALRSVAVASGIAALFANFALCRAALGRRAADVSTLLLAVLPVNVLYSRFGWDVSQTLLVSTLAVYPALVAARDGRNAGAWWCASIVGLLLAVWVHPTNVFLAVFIAVTTWRRNRRVRRSSLSAQRTAGLALLGCVVLVAAGVVARWPESFVQRAAERVVHPGAWWATFLRTQRLLSGATTTEFIAGHPPGGDSLATTTLGAARDDVVGCIAALVVAVGLVLAWRSRARPTVRLLGSGTAGMWAMFHAFAGPEALAPHFERYALCLVLPIVLCLTVAVTPGLTQGARRERVVWSGMLAVATAMLLMVDHRYFQVLARSGGESHFAFRTAQHEPKCALLAALVDQSAGDRSVRVVALDWWTYWPLAYLAEGNERVFVESGPDVAPWPIERRQAPRRKIGETWCVALADAPEETWEACSDAPRTPDGMVLVAQDAAGRSVIIARRGSDSREVAPPLAERGGESSPAKVLGETH
jgi:Dolichyl-phosphate-mannose-protein mannosyltransferase